MHFLKVIEALGIKKEVLKKSTLAKDGVETMRMILAGKADLGVTQIAEVVQADRTSLVGTFPKEFDLAHHLFTLVPDRCLSCGEGVRSTGDRPCWPFEAGEPWPAPRFSLNRDLSAPFHFGIEHSAAQNQCYAIPNDDRHQTIENSIDQPEDDTDDKKQTEGQAYLMGALELEKPPYLWDHSHSRQKSADKSDQFLPVQMFSLPFLNRKLVANPYADNTADRAAH